MWKLSRSLWWEWHIYLFVLLMKLPSTPTKENSRLKVTSHGRLISPNTGHFFFKAYPSYQETDDQNSALLIRAYNQRIKSRLHPVIPGFLAIRSVPLMLFIMVSSPLHSCLIYIYIPIYIYIYIPCTPIVIVPPIYLPYFQSASKDRRTGWWTVRRTNE